jgi:hypothetical protein
MNNDATAMVARILDCMELPAYFVFEIDRRAHERLRRAAGNVRKGSSAAAHESTISTAANGCKAVVPYQAFGNPRLIDCFPQ